MVAPWAGSLWRRERWWQTSGVELVWDSRLSDPIDVADKYRWDAVILGEDWKGNWVKAPRPDMRDDWWQQALAEVDPAQDSFWEDVDAELAKGDRTSAMQHW